MRLHLYFALVRFARWQPERLTGVRSLRRHKPTVPQNPGEAWTYSTTGEVTMVKPGSGRPAKITVPDFVKRKGR